MLSRRAAAFVVMFFGAGACGGSSSETPFPQSADEVGPAMAAVKSRPPASALPELDLPPELPPSPAAGRRPPSPSKPQISISATSTPQLPPGAPPRQ